MLLIAITGPIGSSKTTLASQASAFASLGDSVDGFLSAAGTRTSEGRGAERYDLHFLRDGRVLPFALREDGAYKVDGVTTALTKEWAADLSNRPSADVIFLDEFGKWEAEGNGHMPLWQAIEASDPRTVVMCVREDVLPSIATRLGKPFDLIVSSQDPNALDKLVTAVHQRADWERVGVYGAGSGGIEMSVGSALHTFRFPLTGLVMSSTQSAVLTFAADGLEKRERTVWVALISTGLKALSPSGSRIGPMVAISMQGLLYTLAIRVFGWNRVGAIVAGALVGAWAGAQGFFIQVLLLGRGVQKAYDSAVTWLDSKFHLTLPGLATAVVSVILVYALVSGVITLTVWSRRDRYRSRMTQLVESHSKAPDTARKRRGWLMGLPVLIVAGVLLAAGSSWSSVGWMILRAIAVGLALFGLVRFFDFRGLLRWFQKRGHWGPAFAFRQALQAKGIRDKPNRVP